MPNRLTPLYSKIYYKKENYLKVRTAVFKYITPFIVKVQYIGTTSTSVYKYIQYINTRIYYVTQLPYPVY